MSLFGASDQELNVTIKAKDEASADIAKVTGSVTTLAKGFALGTVAVDALRTGFRFLSGIVTSSIDEFAQYNSAVAQMNSVLASTQHAAGLSSSALIDLAKSLSDVTLYQDDQIISAQNLLLTFTNIGGDVFPKATKAVLDMSTALGQDLSSSAVQLGKALNNPIDGLATLTRVGIQFTGTQQDMITNLVKSGQTVQAQNIILDELSKKFGESAENAYNSASSIVKLEKTVTDLKQSIGSGLTPALNNLFSAFGDVTAGMGQTNDVGKTIFRTIAAVDEVAAAAAVGIHFLGAALVDVASFGAQAIAALNGWDAAEVKFFEDFRTSVDDGVKNTAKFYDDLKARNDAVLKSWGQDTDAAKTFGTVAPAAYQATAAEADAANKKIQDTQKSILDATSTLEDFQKTLKGDDEDAAKAFVDQEQKVSDLRKQIAGEDDPTRRSELNDQLTKESAALEAARPQFANDPAVANEERRAQLTDFQRSLEDIAARRTASIQTDLPRILLNIEFNDVVAGDDGIQKIIQQTIAQLNRATTLSTVAGR